MIRDSLLPEFDQEIASTRKMLERVPAEKFDWTPHPKSKSMIWLAGHVANLPMWATMTLSRDELDLAGPMPPPETPKTTAELVALLDKNAAGAREAIAAADDAAMMKPWTLRMGERVLMTMPRAAVLRSLVMNHLIHHRGQLSVYLRLSDVPLPGMYGPSADEPAMF